MKTSSRPHPGAEIIAAGLLLGLATLSPVAHADETTVAPSVEDGRGPDARRGPLDIRDEHLLAQPRLTLPAVSPHTTAAGRVVLDMGILWSNSFSWTQDIPGEEPGERHFLVDGEALTLAPALRFGVSENLDVGLRVPIRHRGGGSLDRFIDAWHRLLNLEDGARPEFHRDAFRVEGATTDKRHFSWNGREGGGLGDAEMDLRWRARNGGPEGVSLALVVRLSLPTGTGPFEGQGVGGGAQLAAGVPLGRTWDLYTGVGVTVQGTGPVQLVKYQSGRVHGFAAVEWRAWERASLLVETNAASRLVTNVSLYPGVHWLINAEARIDLTPTVRLDLGLTENLMHQQATTDLAFYFGLGWRPGGATIRRNEQRD